MNVECRNPNDIWFPAKAFGKDGDNLKLKFENGPLPDSSYSMKDCRYVRSTQRVKAFTAGDLIDVPVKINEHIGFQRAKVRDVKAGNFLVFDTVEGEIRSDIACFDDCRYINQVKPINNDIIKKAEINLPEELQNHHELVCQIITENIPDCFVQTGENKNVLYVYALSSSVLKRVDVASETFINQAKQKVILTSRREEISKRLEHSSLANKSVLEFVVAKELMGLTIGHEGSNIKAARDIAGVQAIQIDEGNKNDQYSKIKVIAEDDDAAEEARNLLWYITDTVKVPKEIVGKVIGRNGRNIQDVVDKSGVVRVQISEDDEDSPLDYTEFTFTGTHESIELAKFMIDVNIRHIKDIATICESIDENERQLSRTNRYSKRR